MTVSFENFAKGLFALAARDRQTNLLSVTGEDPVEVADVSSEAITTLEYDREKKSLIVTFTSGASYLYFDIDESLYEDIATAGSVGATFVSDLRNAAPGQFYVKM